MSPPVSASLGDFQPDAAPYTLDTVEDGGNRPRQTAVDARRTRLKGVAKVEAAQGVWGKRSKWFLYLGWVLT
jgi:hypothetical protein